MECTPQSARSSRTSPRGVSDNSPEAGKRGKIQRIRLRSRPFGAAVTAMLVRTLSLHFLIAVSCVGACSLDRVASEVKRMALEQGSRKPQTPYYDGSPVLMQAPLAKP